MSFLFHFYKELFNLITNPVVTKIKIQRWRFLLSSCLWR